MIGFVDDKFDLNIVVRLLLQILCAYFLVNQGYQIISLGNIYGFGTVNIGSYGILFSVLCLIYIANSFNYLDGIDGITGAISLISVLFLNIHLYTEFGRIEKFLNLIIIILITFLVFNLSKMQFIKIFLGDSGSYLLGFLIGFLGIYYSYTLNLIKPDFYIWLVALPVFEFLATNLSRLLRKKNVFKPGKDHIHYIIDTDKTKSLLKVSSIHILFIIVGFFIQKINISNFSIYIFIIFFIIYFLLREKKIKN